MAEWNAFYRGTSHLVAFNDSDLLKATPSQLLMLVIKHIGEATSLWAKLDKYAREVHAANTQGKLVPAAGIEPATP